MSDATKERKPGQGAQARRSYAAAQIRFAEAHRRIQNAHAAPLRAILERAADRGERVPPDHQATIATLVGPLFYRRWFSREPIDPEFVQTIIDRALAWHPRHG